jgi:hypothetical protein
MFDDIEFETTAKPSPDELLAFYARQSHAAAEPREKIQRMLDNTFCVVTARRGGELIGLARGVTDGLWGRLAECKLDPRYQGPACITRKDGRIEHDSAGIAREMAHRVIEALRKFGVMRIDALAYGTEVDFCEELGFRRIRGVVPLGLAADAPAPRGTPVPSAVGV